MDGVRMTRSRTAVETGEGSGLARENPEQVTPELPPRTHGRGRGRPPIMGQEGDRARNDRATDEPVPPAPLDVAAILTAIHQRMEAQDQAIQNLRTELLEARAPPPAPPVAAPAPPAPVA